VEYVAWFGANFGSQTRPVGGKAGNGFGLHDMAGNVWEWVNDWFGDYSSEPQVNPQGHPTGQHGQYRVLRGGSRNLDTNHLRASGRDVNSRNVTYYFLGCRAARNP
jgi:formylglycine-generating enzyme required for sulfatase activity